METSTNTVDISKHEENGAQLSELDKYPLESSSKVQSEKEEPISPPSAPARDSPSLSEEEQEEMFRSLRAIFESAEQNDPNLDIQDLISSLELADKESRAGRQDMETLKGVQPKIDQLWRSRSSYMTQSTEVLANGSRDPRWRPYYGRSGILDYFLRVIATDGVEDNILLHALRLIGNSCADTDENRQRVVDGNYTLPLIRLLDKPTLVHVAIPVIYNICLDFEPAQIQAAQNGVTAVLIRLITAGSVEGNALLSYTYELIGMTSEHVDQSPDDSLALMTSLATRPDLNADHFVYLANSLTAYLQNERFQQSCVVDGHVEGVLAVLNHSYEIDDSESSADDDRSLSMLRLKISHTLSDISALPLFPKFYPIASPVTTTLLSWLSGTRDHLQTCACVMLGNLARDDEVCKSMIEDHEIHRQLISVLNSENTKGSVLHAALGFLKNLAIAADNRASLGSAGIIKVVSRLWALETIPQVQLMAVSLARQVIVSSVPNISRLLEPLSSDPDSPASRRTYLSLLLSAFGKSDSAPIRTETGRTVGAVCRSILRLDENAQTLGENKDLIDRLFSLHEDIAYPVGVMVTQTEWPVVQSEGWFALALMASHPSGSLSVANCLQGTSVIQSLCDTVRSAISEPTSGESAQEKTERLKKTKDRDNALFLLHGLVKNKSAMSALPETLQDTFEELLREAGHVPLESR